MAKMPTIIALCQTEVRSDSVKPREDLGFKANFLYTQSDQEAKELEMSKAFNQPFSALHA